MPGTSVGGTDEDPTVPDDPEAPPPAAPQEPTGTDGPARGSPWHLIIAVFLKAVRLPWIAKGLREGPARGSPWHLIIGALLTGF